jgi:hypothetical protein
MRHLNMVYSSPTPRRASATPYRRSGSSDMCCGCAKPFPVRDGRREAQVGQDGRLYCYNRTFACTLLAVRPAA